MYFEGFFSTAKSILNRDGGRSPLRSSCPGTCGDVQFAEVLSTGSALRSALRRYRFAPLRERPKRVDDIQTAEGRYSEAVDRWRDGMEGN